MEGPLVVEWPHSAALGERWFVYPPRSAPSGRDYPGIKAFACRFEAATYALVLWGDAYVQLGRQDIGEC